MAADILALMDLTRERVHAHFGIALEPEMRLVGDFEPELPPELLPYHLSEVLVRDDAPFDLADPRTYLRVQP